MFSQNAVCHSIVTVFDDRSDGLITDAVHRIIDSFGMRVVTPINDSTLEQASLNSALVLVAIYEDSEETFKLVSKLSRHQRLAADIVAVCMEDVSISKMDLFAHGFQCSINLSDLDHVAFSSYILEKIRTGNKRLNSVIKDEEYQRMCDALSCAPASMIVFDQDKKAVFVSDHYFRAYPRIAKRLIRGLSVYDAFDMMMKEEAIPKRDERFKLLQDFWHNMVGRIEFTLDSGTTYSLKAVPLPRSRGTVIVGQNVSAYRNHTTVAERSPHFSGFEALSENVAHILHHLSDRLNDFVQGFSIKIADINHDATNPHKVRMIVEEAREQLSELEGLHGLLEKSVHQPRHSMALPGSHGAAEEIPSETDYKQ